MLVTVRSHAPSLGHTRLCADWMWHPDRLTGGKAAQRALTKRLFSIFSEVLELGSSRVRRCFSHFHLARSFPPSEAASRRAPHLKKWTYLRRFALIMHVGVAACIDRDRVQITALVGSVLAA